MGEWRELSAGGRRRNKAFRNSGIYMLNITY
jgi:hypothetical protein